MSRSSTSMSQPTAALRERFARRLAGQRFAPARLPAQNGDGDHSGPVRQEPGAGWGLRGEEVNELIEALLSDLAEFFAAGEGESSGARESGDSLLRELHSSEMRYRSLLEIAPDAIAILQNGLIVYANAAALRMVGAQAADELVGQALNDHIHPDDLARSVERQRELASGVAAVPPSETRLRTLDGHYILVETRAGACEFHGAPAIQIVARDITERKREELYREEQARILESIATGVSLPEILRELVLMVERLIPGRWCVFYLWDVKARAIRIGAAPSLPAEYNAMTDGLVLGPDTGSFGPAIHSGKTWVTEDIALDPNWAGLREATLSNGLRAVWSTPIIRPDSGPPVEAALGTFAVYSPLPHVPDAGELAIVDRAVHLARIALENDRAEKALRESEARYRQLAEAMPQLVWIAAPGQGIEYVNQRARDAFGDIRAEYLISILHPDDVQLTERRWRQSAATGTPFEVQHRLRLAESGEYRWFLTRWVPVDPKSTETSPRGIGTTTDIHALKEAQNAVLAERDRLTRMAEIAPGVIHTIRVRPDGTRLFEFVGESVADVLGVSAAEVLASYETMNRYVHPDDRERILVSATRSAREMSPWQCEYRVRHPRRGEVWVEARSIPVAEPGGDVLWHGFLTDITRRKTVETALLEEHELLVETQARAHLGYFEWEIATDTVLWSAELYRIFDLDPASFVPTRDSFLERVHPEDRDRVVQSIGDALSSGVGFSHEERIVRPNGEVRYLESRGRVEIDSGGTPRRMTGACLDITERKLAELQLAASERRIRSLADGIPQIVWGANANGELNLFNARAPEYTGLAETELHGWKWGTTIHPEDLRKTVELWTEVLRTGESRPIEFRMRRHDGVYRWFLARQVAVRDDQGVVQGWYGSCTDIHDAREASLAVEANQQRLSAMIRNAPGVAIQFYDRAGRVVLWNAASEQLFGFTSEEALGRRLDQLIHTPEEFRGLLDIFDEIERTGDPVGPSEYTFRRKSGGTGHCLSTLFPIPGESGETWFVCVDVDITERKVAEEKLRDSETLLRAIIDNARCAIWVKDLEGGYRVVNRFFQDLFRSPPEAMPGNPVDEIASPEVARASTETDFVVRRTKRSLDFEETFVADGVERTLLVTKFPILDACDRVSAVAGIATDITEHIRLEEQLRQAQKMEAIGQLAGGVAHDFNNMLLVINGYAEMVLERIEPEHPHHAALAGIREAGRRASGLTSQLLAFSRKSPIRPRRLEVNQVVTASESLLNRLIGENIALILTTDPGIGPIRADRGHLEQVLLNLVVNARDAMPEGGEIRIETTPVLLPVSSDGTGQGEGTSERFVRIAVTDTGCGMPAEVVARVFEPFYTTKGVGRGTGLGLAVVHGVVTQNGGYIHVRSEVGGGTTFEIFFPELVED